MRIALFSDFSLDQINGVSHVLLTMMDALTARGHSVRAYVPCSGSDSDTRQRKPHVVPLRSVGMPWAPMFRLCSPFGVPKDLRQFQPDVLHTHTFGPVGFRSLSCARQLQCPIVGTEHTLPAEYAHYIHLDYACVRRSMQRFAGHFYNRCDVVIAPSRIVADELREFGVQKKISILPSAIDTSRFRNLGTKDALKKKWNIGESSVLSFGRLEKEKSIDQLLYAFSRLHAEQKTTELIIVGEGSQRNALETLAQNLEIHRVTKFLGQLSGTDLVDVINACDVYAITSESETQSLTTMQAMACGLPVVAVRSGALPEFVLHGESGFIVEPRNAEEMATRLQELLVDTSKREVFGRRGEQLAQTHSPESMAEKLEKIYTDLIHMSSEER